MNNGAWIKVEDEETEVCSNTAVITSLEGLTVLDNWQGLTMNLGTATKIGNVGTADNSPKGTYTIGGQRSGKTRGLVIETDGQQTRKVIRR